MSETNQDVLRVDVWSDVVCPWCYIGKRRFEEALRRYNARGDGPPVEVTYHAFLLAPDVTGDDDQTAGQYMARKGMAPAQVEQMFAQVTALAAAEGLEYHFETTHQTSTLAAHELVRFARGEGRQLEMVERLFRAFFTEGRHLGRADELATLAAEVGLDGDEARAALAEHRFADDVQADLAQAAAYGITGVPFFVVDEQFGVSGAQSPDVLLQVLDRAVEARSTQSVR